MTTKTSEEQLRLLVQLRAATDSGDVDKAAALWTQLTKLGAAPMDGQFGNLAQEAAVKAAAAAAGGGADTEFNFITQILPELLHMFKHVKEQTTAGAVASFMEAAKYASDMGETALCDLLKSRATKLLNDGEELS